MLAGQIPTASDFTDLQRKSVLVDAVNANTNPIASAQSFSSSVQLSALSLTGDLIAGETYLITGQMVYSVSNTDTELNLSTRLNTSGGTVINETRLGRNPFTTNGQQANWAIPYVAATTASTTFVFTLQRGTGTGNTTVEGGKAAWNSLIRLAAGGAIRVV